MSKLTKLIKSPKLFFYDALKKEFEPKVQPKVQPKASTKLDKNMFMQISNFAASYPVNSIKIDDEYLWPYLRAHLWLNINYLSTGNNRFRTINPYGIQLGHRSNLPFFKREELAKKYQIKEIKELGTSNESIDFLFITSLNAAEQVVLENKKIYNRISDPLLEIAMNLGNAKRLEMVKVNTPSLKKVKSYTHKPMLVFAPNITKTGYFEKLNLHRFFYPMFKNKIPAQVLNEKIMHELTDWEMHTRDYYVMLLKKLKPKVIILNGYHYYSPLFSAADSLGIVTVDIQHGLQVGWNPLYNNWDEMPPEGYQALPDFFAVWGKKEFDNIKEVFTGSKHQPIIIGNLWFQRQKNETSDMGKSFKKNILSYQTKILLAMQNQGEVPQFFKDIIENAPQDIIWIIRHHPKGERFKSKDFSKKNQDNIMISKEIDEASWSQLLKHIDVTISEGSALALESDGFGSYNIITSPEGKENYRKEIEEGKFFYAEKVKEFYEILDTLDLTDKKPKVDAFEEVNIESVLQTFLDKYHEKQNKRIKDTYAK